MISDKIIKAILKVATSENKNKIICNIIEHLNTYDYNNVNQNHILEMLVDITSFVEIEDIDLESVKEYANKNIYKREDIIVKNIGVDHVDNIDCVVIVTYEWKDKINEDKDDVDFTKGYITINFMDHPEVLKKS